MLPVVATFRLAGADRRAQGVQGVAQGGDRGAGDLPLGLVLVIDLHELVVALLYLLWVLVRRAEQQLLKLIEQVLPGLLGHLTVRDASLEVTDERGGCRRGRREPGGMP